MEVWIAHQFELRQYPVRPTASYQEFDLNCHPRRHDGTCAY